MFPIPDQIDDLEEWVSKNKNKYFRNVDTSICSKWKEYHYYNKVPLPCCCKVRTVECIFLECFYKIKYVNELIKNKNLYIKAFDSYRRIKHNLPAIMEWVMDNEDLYNTVLQLNSKIRIMTQLEPHQSHYIKLPQKDLIQILEFKSVFIKHFYSEEYENY